MSSVTASRSTARSITKSRRTTRAKTADLMVSYALTRAILFGGVAVCVYFVSSMLGQVQMEVARKEGLRVRMRLAAAVTSTDALRRRVDDLTDPVESKQWASTRGFVRPLSIPPAPGIQEGTLVARNDH